MPKFVPRQRKHKGRDQDSHNTSGEPHNGADTNTPVLLPASKTEREEKRQKLKAELREQQSKISSKKQKRLDKYIARLYPNYYVQETKLRNDETQALIKKLSRRKVDTSSFQSSRVLNFKKQTRHERPPKDGGVELGEGDHNLTDDESDFSDAHIKKSKHGLPNRLTPVSEEQKPISTTSIGRGLKRPLELDSSGNPVIKKRTKRQKLKQPVAEEIPWNGLSDTDEEDNNEYEHEAPSNPEEDDSSQPTESDEDDGAEDESGSNSSEEEEEDTANKKPRFSAFKEWATQQVNDALGFTPSGPITTAMASVEASKNITFEPRPLEQDPLPQELEVKETADSHRKAYSVLVERSEEIQTARLKLPVVAEEQKIMEAIHNHSSVVIWGATGSGKTTQVPQFLYEAGYGDPNGPTPGLIGVTQPRRVAAVSMAERVAEELGSLRDRVAHQIRFESTVNKNTAIKFMTDGVLLREISQDFYLTKYSVIIIDEAHERSANTDILIGMLCRIVDLRAKESHNDPKIKPLKLVVMSATLKISDFIENSKLFRRERPPLIQAEGRQYPVTIHFARKTNHDYVEEAFRKVCRGHRKLPPGGMLVFLTGQNEISDLAKRLRNAFPITKGSYTKDPHVEVAALETPLEIEDFDITNNQPIPESKDDFDSEPETDEEFEDEHGFNVGEGVVVQGSTPLHVLPLYAQLPTKDQLKVFQPPPDESRLIILATNVAETSLTIPGIRYVFDCGRAKDRKYDQTTGVQSFEVGWISKASASQRAGRAGRTGPGHCYRLYSSSVYERDFEEYSKPELLRTPIESIVLQLKRLGITKVINFPFPTPPDRESIQKAERLLTNLGAISPDNSITELGQNLSIFPISPRLSKMLLLGFKLDCAPYVIALVAALSVFDIFIPENQLDSSSDEHQPDFNNSIEPQDPEQTQRHKRYSRAHRAFSTTAQSSDAIKMMSALCAYAWASTSQDPSTFCTSHFLRPKALKEATLLRHQLTQIAHANWRDLIPKPSNTSTLTPPAASQITTLKKITAAAHLDHVAIRADLLGESPPKTPRRLIDVPYIPLFLSYTGRALNLIQIAVYIHPSSVLAHSTSAKFAPEYLIYAHLQKPPPTTTLEDQQPARQPKTRMHPLTPISGTQLAELAAGTPLLRYGKPIGKIRMLEDGVSRKCYVQPTLVGEAGGREWGLPARKVVQRRVAGQGWVTEKVVG
ncbi:MAG: putative ATP-dependent RNA helicase DHR1 [Cirrosporium novae-zelandiae]|nr:MAG: putative ATP-dependent RNA helicase DHR1 [Cirrosporium novae-zelandiae]